MDKEIKLTLDGSEDKFESIEDIENKLEETKKTEITLTDEEKKQIEDFAEKIDLKDSNMVIQYGSGAQKKISNFSEQTLEKVRNKDLEEVGDLLTGLVTGLKNFDTEEEKGFLSIFKKSANKLNSLKSKYQTVEANVDNVKKVLEDHQIRLLKDVATLDYMYDLNRDYYRELVMYIEAGKLKIERAKNVDLKALQDKAQESGLPVDAQKVNDYQNLINRFEKKLYDLELTKAISLQMAPQIRMVQSSNSIMAEKIQSTIVNTIPLWKSQMVLSLSAGHSLEAAKAQKEVTDYTNELLRKNADKVKQSTIDTSRESERGLVDIETIKYTNQALIDALNEVKKIQAEGYKKRQEASIELKKLEGDLKNSLLK
ncbi:toxic anion resistance protein [Peptoniphilus catoniae]|uniref:toxic anion resistance protein n=1 Tax=Peptoniphilus catoniae TaxID=1660341 RepID=UPI0010FD15D7|nr:toxic anion resistance protein [Peptoniphilus catoniae]